MIVSVRSAYRHRRYRRRRRCEHDDSRGRTAPDNAADRRKSRHDPGSARSGDGTSGRYKPYGGNGCARPASNANASRFRRFNLLADDLKDPLIWPQLFCGSCESMIARSVQGA